MSNQQNPLNNLVKMVAEEKLLLHDDRQNLVSQEELVEAISTTGLVQKDELTNLTRSKLLLPVEDDGMQELFHVGITLDFLSFLQKLEITGFPFALRQKIAEMYYPLFWAMCSDIEYEISKLQKEKGRDLTRPELAYLRVINEWAVAETMGRIEQKILKLEAEGGPELQQLIQEAAQRKKTLKKKANFGYEENQIKRTIKEIWQYPLVIFQGREIKAFIDIDSIECTDEEKRMLWGGHFDFALCDRNGVLQLAIEYNGGGHYGRREAERKRVQSRDNAKKNICEKAGVPLVVLTSEFALLENYKKLLREFLRIFTEKTEDIDAQYLYDLIYEQFNASSLEQLKAGTLDRNELARIAHRLDIYKSQERKDMLLALLWEVYTISGNLSKLADVSDTIQK